MVIAAADIAVFGLLGKALGTTRIAKAQPVRIAIDAQRQLRRAYRPTGPVFDEIPVSRCRRVPDQQSRQARRAWPDVQPDDMGRDGAELDCQASAAIVLGVYLQRALLAPRANGSLDPARITWLKVGGRSRRLGGPRYQPRSIHSSRCGRSRPMVVGLPCPGNTSVSSGRTNSLCRMLSMIVGKLA